MSRFGFWMTAFVCLWVVSHPPYLSAAEFPEELVEDLSLRLHRNVTAQLDECRLEEKISETKPLEVDGVRVGTYEEFKQIDARAIPESFTLRIGGIRVTEKAVGVDLKVGCEIAGKACYLKAGPIPVSLRSGYVGRVIVRGRLAAQVESTDSGRVLSDFSFTTTQLEVRGIRWSQQNVDVLKEFLQAAIAERMQKEKLSALLKLNDDLSRLRLSDSLLEVR